MTAGNFVVRPDALDYLAGLSLDLGSFPPEASWPVVPPPARRLTHIRGVGSSKLPGSPHDPALPVPTEPLLAGLAGESIPLAFQVVGGGDGVKFGLGTWGGEASGAVDVRQAVLTSLLNSIYPLVDGADVADTVGLGAFPLSAVVCGVPGGASVGSEKPWDRLLRGLRGNRFAVVVLAEPVPTDDLARLRDTALEDLRVARAAQNARTDLPLTEEYGDKVNALVTSLVRALLIGGWRTGVYLLGDQTTFWRLAATWRGVFSDGAGSTSPLRVVRSDDAARLAGGWALPRQEAPRGPRVWRHPFLNQSLLDTRQLAALVHLPTLETPGFSIRPASEFAVAHEESRDPSRAVRIGAVLAQETVAGTAYRIGIDDLTRHAFVGGLTGSGKTNTLMYLLTEVAAVGVPFLVIEPAKTEYRELLGRRPGLGDSLRVFTPGREQIAPLRMNPFEVPDGTDVSTHLDLLKAVFAAAFPMWVPLPQVLEQCLVQLYSERGWDFTTGKHRDTRSKASADVPTLGDLVASVVRTVPTLGYKGETTQEITAALTTSLNSLRRSSRGLMLDVERSIPIAELLNAPTVIELEGLGDDADKAFVMGLLLVRLYEHRRAEYAAELATAAAAGRPAPRRRLGHLVVVEEAHRLLAQSHKATDSWNVDPQGAFADAFSQMLSEIRAYGQGMVIADQVPVRLAPDVLKNTNLKIAHRLVAGDDRKAMAEAMSMSDEQSRVLSTLRLGRAAVFSEGDHTPVIVAVEKAKDRDDAPAVDDDAVARVMAVWRADPSIAPYFADNQFCAGVCRTPSECRRARQQTEEPTGRLLVHRLFNTAIVHTDGLDVVWPDVVAYVSSRTPTDAGADLDARVHSFAVHAMHAAVTRRAMQGSWPAPSVDTLTAAVRDAVAERVRLPGQWLGATAARQALVDAGAAVVRRTHDPYRLCAAICTDGTCRYRDSASDVLTHPRHESHDADLRRQQDPAGYVRQVAENVAVDVTAAPVAAPSGERALTDARWRSIGCAALVTFGGTDHPDDAATVVTAALAAAGWVLDTGNGSGGTGS